MFRVIAVLFFCQKNFKNSIFCWRKYKSNILNLSCNIYKNYFIKDNFEITHKKITGHLPLIPHNPSRPKKPLNKWPLAKCPRFF